MCVRGYIFVTVFGVLKYLIGFTFTIVILIHLVYIQLCGDIYIKLQQPFMFSPLEVYTAGASLLWCHSCNILIYAVYHVQILQLNPSLCCGRRKPGSPVLKTGWIKLHFILHFIFHCGGRREDTGKWFWIGWITHFILHCGGVKEYRQQCFLSRVDHTLHASQWWKERGTKEVILNYETLLSSM